MKCGVLETTHLLGKKWSVVILTDLRTKKFKGFYNFTLNTKISPRILSKQLKELEKEGLIKKSVRNYSITQKGEELCRLLDGIKKWGVKWNQAPKNCLSRTCTECKLFMD